MVDIYLEGAEVHAEAPEEEQEAALILNAVLSGKTTPADGCICPDKRDSTIGKGITMRFCDGTGVTITPTLDVEGNPELEICCGIGDFDQEELDETVYYEVTLQSKPVLRSYIAAAYAGRCPGRHRGKCAREGSRYCAGWPTGRSPRHCRGEHAGCGRSLDSTGKGGK